MKKKLNKKEEENKTENGKKTIESIEKRGLRSENKGGSSKVFDYFQQLERRINEGKRRIKQEIAEVEDGQRRIREGIKEIAEVEDGQRRIREGINKFKSEQGIEKKSEPALGVVDSEEIIKLPKPPRDSNSTSNSGRQRGSTLRKRGSTLRKRK